MFCYNAFVRLFRIRLEGITIKNIFVGMLLVFLNFNLDIGSIRIGLIPTFLGYIFMLRGLSELEGFSEHFRKVSLYVKGMAVYSGICYAMDLFGVSSLIGEPISFVLGLLSTAFSLFISYKIIMGVRDIEAARAQDLNSGQLYSTWKLLAAFSLITYGLYLVPALMIVCIIISFVVGIYYLYVFNKTKNLFYANLQ